MLKRLRYRNKVASFVVDNTYDTVRRNTRSKPVITSVNRLLRSADKYTEGCVLISECYQVSRRIRQRQHLNKKTCNEYLNLVADVIWYLNVCSRRHSYKFAKDLVYELTLPNWEKLHRDSLATKQTAEQKLVDTFCCDLEYFSDRWSLSRLFRSVYQFGDILVHNSIDVYDLCYHNRFHKWSGLL